MESVAKLFVQPYPDAELMATVTGEILKSLPSEAILLHFICLLNLIYTLSPPQIPEAFR